ncbi:hypothetical protein BH23VER1_BH23VER1_19300 [soil metagenome]
MNPVIEIFLRIMVFLMGASIGSFLNVVIYRVPLGISVGDPKRSFCPHCKEPIPWYQNIPVFSWIALRGRCAGCGAGISPRYLGVEVLTGLLFLVLWLLVAERLLPLGMGGGWWLVVPYWVLVSLCVVTVFVDLEHFIIPDGVTVGGTVAGLAFSTLMPKLMGADRWWEGLGWSAFGAAAGFGILWVVVELGKKAFGRLKLDFGEGARWVACQDEKEEEPALTLGEESYLWSDLFFRKSDRLIIEAQEVAVQPQPGVAEGRRFGRSKVTISEAGFLVEESGLGGGAGEAGEFFELETLERVDGTALKVVIPREAMGFGDVKFMAMVGAFLGWQAVLFTIFVASVSGTAVALPARLLGREGWASKVPFGPYLVLGALLWVFAGEAMMAWYFGLLR